MSHPTKPTDIGMNRTGIAISPIDAQKTIDGAIEGTPNAHSDISKIDEVRVSYSRESPPVGTMPLPASLKGAAQAVIDKFLGEKTAVLLDKMGERLAFERGGTRLYEALLCKFEAADVHEGGPTREEIETIRDEELAHVALLARSMEALGADPTAVTPCADVVGVASKGIFQVLNDPHTTLTQCLDAMLTAELTDNEGWQMLADLADDMGHNEMANEFRVALEEEQKHLEWVRSWVTAAVRGQAGITPTPEISEEAKHPTP